MGRKRDQIGAAGPKSMQQQDELARVPGQRLQAGAIYDFCQNVLRSILRARFGLCSASSRSSSSMHINGYLLGVVP